MPDTLTMTPLRRAGLRLLSLALLLSLTLWLSGCGGGATAAPNDLTDPVAVALAATNDRINLGQQIFTDANLSEPRGTACAACHQANMGFAGNHGGRNGEAVGGLFWDGRADSAELQALGPLLNPLEMNNLSKKSVVDKIAQSRYAALFRQVFGADIFANTDAAFTSIGVAIAAFERARLQPFSSKYDAMVRGQTTLSPTEARGMALFMEPTKGNCAGCHLMNPTSGKPEDSAFSEFTYYATGIPRNPAIPKNADPAFYDLGLCGPDRTPPTLPDSVAPGVTISNFCGQFRMPTLRNVAERPAFMHNGFFRNLTEVVRFYSSRNSDPLRWYGQAVSNDLPTQYLGNIEKVKAPFNRAANAGPALSELEIADIVAFLHTLSDGFTAAP